MIKNRFYKTTQGFPFELLVAKTAPDGINNQTVEAFVAGATVLDVAAFVMDKATGKPQRKVLGTGLSTADKAKQIFFAVEDKANSIISTTPIPASGVTAEKIAYKAPTNQVSVLSNVAGTISTTQELAFKVIETTPGTNKLPIWDYNLILTGGAAAAYQKLATWINSAKDEEFFTASVNAITNPTFANATFSSGAVAGIAVTDGGSGIVTAALPSGTGTLPVTISGGGGSGATAVANIVDGVVKSVTITAGGSGYSGTVTGSLGSLTVLPGIKITSTDPNRHFRLSAVIHPTKQDSVDYGVVFSVINPIKAYAGTGTLEHLLELQKEANVLRGIGHYYPAAGYTAAEFGLPKDIVTESGATTWDLVVIRAVKTENSPTPLEQHRNPIIHLIALPSGSLADKIVALFA